jgi:head-tail adaptor
MTLQKATETTGAGGRKVQTWQAAATVWVTLAPARGYETAAQGQRQAGTFYTITTRRPMPAGVTPTSKMRFAYDSGSTVRTFEVTAPPREIDRPYYGWAFDVAEKEA